MAWVKEGVNYWENPDCPTEYLRRALIAIIYDVEGFSLPLDYFDNKDREYLVKRITFYEYVSDK